MVIINVIEVDVRHTHFCGVEGMFIGSETIKVMIEKNFS